jgi:anti-sigma B factor antagonist
MTPGKKHLQLERREGGICARFLIPRITNVNDIRAIGDELFELLEKDKPAVLVLDLGKVNYIPSAMLGKLGSVRAAVRQYGCSLRLTGIQGSVAQLFQVTRLDRIFEICPDVESAFRREPQA